jgi:hypothetical protein
VLQTAAVSAEALGVLPGSIERGLRERVLPPLELLSKKASSKARDLPQVRPISSQVHRLAAGPGVVAGAPA